MLPIGHRTKERIQLGGIQRAVMVLIMCFEKLSKELVASRAQFHGDPFRDIERWMNIRRRERQVHGVAKGPEHSPRRLETAALNEQRM